ncbi:hypothetical protein ACFPAF_21075 [Hymenobacter endophyticus]|uniref:Uncharacterized protein n=1 Tax=Hymenobacter endophyticus TaxID=3076335 RepID=A0ABU3TNF9_9BACT|nr:hypothetical protein [Hymenobacter endophyticus]MDU0372904.1 hypothetical protein [Hymenobacter endophyticus]
MTTSSIPSLEQQLNNLANMAERVATPEFQQGFRASVSARAKAAGSFLTYRDQQGRLVREWPGSGRIELLG